MGSSSKESLRLSLSVNRSGAFLQQEREVETVSRQSRIRNRYRFTKILQLDIEALLLRFRRGDGFRDLTGNSSFGGLLDSGRGLDGNNSRGIRSVRGRLVGRAFRGGGIGFSSRSFRLCCPRSGGRLRLRRRRRSVSRNWCGEDYRAKPEQDCSELERWSLTKALDYCLPSENRSRRRLALRGSTRRSLDWNSATENCCWSNCCFDSRPHSDWPASGWPLEVEAGWLLKKLCKRGSQESKDRRTE